jgi:rhamnosyltransferase
MNYVVVVPTLNAADDWERFSSALLANVAAERVLIVDSESTDGTKALAEDAGFRVYDIKRDEFNHGGTRQLAVDLSPEAEIVVFLTQDAVLESSHSISNLLASFEREDVGAAFGRQIPHPYAKPIEFHARIFNYPSQSSMRTLADKELWGFKAIFISNSFSAYRRHALDAVGGFPKDVIFGEDTMTAAKMLLSGWKIGYVAEAPVYHSHSYEMKQEFKRYFDIGVLHARENWLLEEFGGAGGEGMRFVKSEIRFLWPRYFWLIPSALVRTALKLMGYRLGRIEDKLSKVWKRRLSMNRQFWS